ncbi:MAG: hypothetical protein IJU24_04570 [Bacteroidaceae bacterium]|jgi:hypothetical protein|nr:hypothetical protein [Bacteroidaceae bacterium]
MKKGSLILATAAVLLMLTGCQKEEFAEAPVYGDIYCSSSHPEVGDTVYLRVQIIYAGNRINSGAYNWKIRDPFSEITSITTRFIRKTGEKSLSQVPETQWIPKEEGNHIINMSAKFSYSMGDRNSIMRGSASAYGSVKVYPKSN